jgi:histidinol phosphatase-like enzyme
MRLIKKKIFFDIDNTICVTKGSDYKNSKPKKNIIKLINKLYEKNEIVFYTSRYMGRYNSNKSKVLKKYSLTFNQLKKWNLKFDKLIMCKPRYDILIDDKAYNNKDKIIKKLLKEYV